MIAQKYTDLYFSAEDKSANYWKSKTMHAFRFKLEFDLILNRMKHCSLQGLSEGTEHKHHNGKDHQSVTGTDNTVGLS